MNHAAFLKLVSVRTRQEHHEDRRLDLRSRNVNCSVLGVSCCTVSDLTEGLDLDLGGDDLTWDDTVAADRILSKSSIDSNSDIRHRVWSGLSCQ